MVRDRRRLRLLCRPDVVFERFAEKIILKNQQE